MKVIFEETIGKMTEAGCRFKLYARCQEHGEPYNMPYLFYTERFEHDELLSGRQSR